MTQYGVEEDLLPHQRLSGCPLEVVVASDSCSGAEEEDQNNVEWEEDENAMKLVHFRMSCDQLISYHHLTCTCKLCSKEILE